MPLSQLVLLALSIVFLIIGLYEGFTIGFGDAYWSIMLSVGLFFFYLYRKRDVEQ